MKRSSLKLSYRVGLFGCLVQLSASPVIATQSARSDSSASPVAGATCSLTALQRNMQARAEVEPDPQTSIVQTSSPMTSYVSNERRVACSVVDLLQLGFELKAAQRHGPEDSTNGSFEEILYLQRGSLLLKCYDELTLSARSDSARVMSSRSACQQVVRSRLRPRGDAR